MLTTVGAHGIPNSSHWILSTWWIPNFPYVGNSGSSGDPESSVPEEEHLEIDKEISPDSTMLLTIIEASRADPEDELSYTEKLQPFTWQRSTGTSSNYSHILLYFLFSM